MQWCAFLCGMAVFLVFVYNVRAGQVARLSPGIWTMLYFALIAAEVSRGFLVYIGLSWWVGVIGGFLAFLIGEIFSLFLKQEGKTVKRRGQVIPSFFTSASVLLVLAWLTIQEMVVFEAAHLMIISIAAASVLFLVLVSGMTERLRLSDVNVSWRGLPILLISAALLMLGVYGFQRLLTP